MRDYSYQDMLKMQEDAALRVREMKKRATLVMDDDRSQSDGAAETSEKKGIISLLLSDSDAVLVMSILALLSAENSDGLTELALLYILL